MAILQDKVKRLDSVPNSYATTTDRAQAGILRQVLRLLDNLDRDADGFILLTAQNQAEVEAIANGLSQAIFDSEYRKALIEFTSEIRIQSELTDSYFTSILKEKFEPEQVFQNIILSSQRNAIRTFNEASIDQAVVNPIRDFVNSGVNSKQRYADLVDSITKSIIGSEDADGLLLRHVKGFARDTFSISDRTYVQAISDELGFVWSLYLGSKVKDTRLFCALRKGKYFHKKEIQSWGSSTYRGEGTNGAGSWQGRWNQVTNPTSIFFLLGGHECLDELAPVVESQVPKSAIDRAKRMGFI